MHRLLRRWTWLTVVATLHNAFGIARLLQWRVIMSTLASLNTLILVSRLHRFEVVIIHTFFDICPDDQRTIVGHFQFWNMRWLLNGWTIAQLPTLLQLLTTLVAQLEPATGRPLALLPSRGTDAMTWVIGVAMWASCYFFSLLGANEFWNAVDIDLLNHLFSHQFSNHVEYFIVCETVFLGVAWDRVATCVLVGVGSLASGAQGLGEMKRFLNGYRAVLKFGDFVRIAVGWGNGPLVILAIFIAINLEFASALFITPLLQLRSERDP